MSTIQGTTAVCEDMCVSHRRGLQAAVAPSAPQGLSIACSTPHAIAWDESWANSHEISGRAMAGVHNATVQALPSASEQPVANGVAAAGAASQVCHSLSPPSS